MINLIARIEGHGHLELDFNKNKARLVISEGERFFEQLVVDRHFQEAPFIACRICGICPVAHSLGAIKALENTLGIKVNKTIINLRKLMLCSQIINSHIIHLFFLVLPDFTPEKEKGVEIIKFYPAEYNLVLNIKRVCDQILEIIGGRVVHPITPIVGGFTKEPDKNRLSSLILDIEQVLDEAEDLVLLFNSLKYPQISKFKPIQLCLDNRENYSYYQGKISSSTGFQAKAVDYQKVIIEKVKYGSPVKYSSFCGQPFMVGALSRLNRFSNKLNRRTMEILKKISFKPPSTNPFFINIAQSIEILHFLEEARKLLYWLNKAEKEEVQLKIPQKSGQGAGAIEAPRGTLYYSFKIKDSRIKYCDIITPTVQNLACIDAAVNALLAENRQKPNKEKKRLVELLIRSFDPCITCAVH